MTGDAAMNELLFWIVCVLAVLFVLAALWLLLRFVLLLRAGGAVQCSLRNPHAKWRTGVLILGQDSLSWYRARSISPVARRVITRENFVLVSHRPSKEDPETMIIEVLDGDFPLVAAMSANSFAGLVSWIDSAPPGVQRTGL
ncbi:hypothetical protein DD236_11775 [Ancrocorticia populi]|uniref:DUF2550 domain-containing protein n=2 Tax=Ancrocorticia populi TaxID=2175228 RepID=A0A2V1JZI5_9ACTO|nr:hypothetical protein DD236_11775 [Ancrocorticia populi]